MSKQNYAFDAKQLPKEIAIRLKRPDEKHVAMDNHKETTVIGVCDNGGRVIYETIVPTEEKPLLEFIGCLGGTINLTFEEGTHANWLFNLLEPRVSFLLVCDPRRNRELTRGGNKSDKLDVRMLLQLFRGDMLKGVYHRRECDRTLKELVRNYDTWVKDTARQMNRIKAIYRGRAIRSSARLYSPNQRENWLSMLKESGVRLRAEHLFAVLDYLRQMRQKARAAMIAESRRHASNKALQTIRQFGPVRVAQLIAHVGTPKRFRGKEQFWAYCGLAVVTQSSADYSLENGRLKRNHKNVQTRGLNQNHNHHLKEVFKSAAVAAIRSGEFKEYYQERIARGMRPEMARLCVARKLAAIALMVYKKGESYDPTRVNKSAA
jgi:transposase